MCQLLHRLRVNLIVTMRGQLLVSHHALSRIAPHHLLILTFGVIAILLLGSRATMSLLEITITNTFQVFKTHMD